MGIATHTRTLNRVSQVQQAKSSIEADYVLALADFAASGESVRSRVEELSQELRITRERAEKEMVLSTELLRLPHVVAALRAGVIDLYKAFKVAEQTLTLSDEHAARLDEIMQDRLDKTPRNLLQAVGRVLHKLDPKTMEKKREAKKQDRKVSLHHDDHEWSTLSIDLPSHVASAIYQKLSCAARDLRAVDKTRTTDQIRADITADVLMAMAEGDSTVKAHVYVYVDMLSLLQLNNEPGYLPGYGHIPAEMAKEIATDPNSTWQRILTDPDNGQVLSVGRTKYRPPASLDRYVRTKGKTCQHPGCNQPAMYTDIDHVHDWAKGGDTDAEQLRCLCRYHHLLKNEPGWTYEAGPNGSLTITTPAGRKYTTRPEPLHEPRLKAG